jgi:hypothetical protein
MLHLPAKVPKKKLDNYNLAKYHKGDEQQNFDVLCIRPRHTVQKSIQSYQCHLESRQFRKVKRTVKESYS